MPESTFWSRADEQLTFFNFLILREDVFMFHISFYQINYILSNGKSLLHDLTNTFLPKRIGLVGRNGVGKSTLFKFITGEIRPNSGNIHCEGSVVYLPQNPEFSVEETLGDLLEVSAKIAALARINQGGVESSDFECVGDDWDIITKIKVTLETFGLEALSLDRLLSSLSGGQLTRAWLAKISLSNADFLLLDEPTNHLDTAAREMFYSFVASSQKGIVVISHDRALLNLMDEIVELNGLGLVSYGGNYEFYKEQKAIEQAAKEHDFEAAKKAFDETRGAIQDSKEKHDSRRAQGVALRKAGKVDKLTANSRQGRSERSQNKMLIKHERMIEQAQTDWAEAREALEIVEEIKVDLPNTYVPAGKVILDIENLSFAYPDSKKNILNNISLKIVGIERIAIKGNNGSGKTTLIKLIIGELLPIAGTIFVGSIQVCYCDQNTRLLNPELSIVNNFLRMNPESTTEEAYRALAQFLFRNVAAEKLVKHLSGGERLRALLACILLSKTPPQLLILDEPTNHLDLSSIEKIEAILNLYRGALVVISHDEVFLENIKCRDNFLQL